MASDRHAARRVAAITGASSGIGEEFARQLAAQGYDLVLTARRANLLETIKDDLNAKYGVEVDVLVADLADAADLDRVVEHVRAMERIDMLVNNAGFGARGKFAEREIDVYQRMLRVHVEATVRLTHAALPAMLRQGSGAVINVSSTAAFVRQGGSAMYTSTKKFLNVFSENLQGELRGTGIKLQALCPGYTYSGFHDTHEYRDFSRSQVPSKLWLSSEQVVRESLDALRGNSVVVVPTLRYKFVTWTLTSPIGAFAVRVRNKMRGR